MYNTRAALLTKTITDLISLNVPTKTADTQRRKHNTSSRWPTGSLWASYTFLRQQTHRHVTDRRTETCMAHKRAPDTKKLMRLRLLGPNKTEGFFFKLNLSVLRKQNRKLIPNQSIPDLSLLPNPLTRYKGTIMGIHFSFRVGQNERSSPLR